MRGRSPGLSWGARFSPPEPSAPGSSPRPPGSQLGDTPMCRGLRPGRGRSESRRARPLCPTRRAQAPGGPGDPAPSMHPDCVAPTRLSIPRTLLPSAPPHPPPGARSPAASTAQRHPPPPHRTHQLPGARRRAAGPPAERLWPRGSGRPWLRGASASAGKAAVASGSERRPRAPEPGTGSSPASSPAGGRARAPPCAGEHELGRPVPSSVSSSSPSCRSRPPLPPRVPGLVATFRR